MLLASERHRAAYPARETPRIRRIDVEAQLRLKRPLTDW
ncbi:hypothetical protein MBELCI_1664 [Limimaricola cinnabarinus LL-001]|uniref:Uncharacterized protein n=1 Tax=Limimaricola cinnabarinus LL-001 TaxID=1337093 RepID=U2Z3F5_9RHOB|nr:hypothetical protein MBELCI_1664 [Limimaricola cinnabarinus LL-001]